MGQYPVDADDAVQMCAIQMQAQSGPHLLEDPRELDKSLGKYLIPQVALLLFVLALLGELIGMHLPIMPGKIIRDGRLYRCYSNG